MHNASQENLAIWATLMYKIGIRAHDIGKFNAIKLAQTVKSRHFEGVQLVFKKAIDQDIDFNNLQPIKEAFKDIDVMMLGAYFNPVHPDQEMIDNGIDNFKKHIAIASSLNCSFVGSETGSYMGKPWGYMPENHTQQALEQVIDIFQDLVDEAEKHGVCVAIEGAYAHVAYSPKRIKEVVDRIHNPHLKVTVDLFNFLHIGNYKQRNEIFDEALNLLRDDIVIFHFKDFIVENNQLKQVGLGQGMMDYNYIIRRIKKEIKQAYIIFEGVVGDDIDSSYTYISNIFKEGK